MSHPNFILGSFGLVALASGFSVALILGGCDGSATQTTTGQGLNGTLVDTQGNPVSGAQVKAWPIAASPNGLPNHPDSLNATLAQTDAQGHYSLTGLDAGLYNVFAEKGQGEATVFIPRIKYIEQVLDLGVDTLTAPGAIAGLVQSGGEFLSPVFCYLQGSTYVALTDSTGHFLMEKIPAGTYRLNYVSQGYASLIDSPIVVVSGKTTVAQPQTLGIDLDAQPPAPRIIQATYDTAQGVVTLMWNQTPVSDLNGYYVETYRLGHDSEAYNSRDRIWDTVYTSSIGQNWGYGFDSTQDYSYTQVYRIRSIDWDGNVSRITSPPIALKITRPGMTKYALKLKLLEGDRDTTVCRDTLIFVMEINPVTSRAYTASWNMTAWNPSFGGISVNLQGKNTTPLVESDTLVWVWNREAYQEMDWIDSSYFTTRPDSVKIIAHLVGGEEPWFSDKRVIDIGLDANKCYQVHKSRLPRDDDY
jgi:hypothetical protein